MRRVAEAESLGELLDSLCERLGARRHEASELLAALLDQPRHWPLLHRDDSVQRELWARAMAAADKLLAGAPLAYAVGRANFRQLSLAIDERVLIPRPETELLIDLVVERAPRGGVAVDVGTGSGAIALSLAAEGNFERVIATDISPDALSVARHNAALCAPYLRAPVEFSLGSLLSAVPISHVSRPISAVVSNPPYISFNEVAELPASVRDWEPAAALLSGGNGLAITARLVRQAADRLEPTGLLALEVDSRRASLVAEMVSADSRYESVSVHLDLAGRERFVLAKRRTDEERA